MTASAKQTKTKTVSAAVVAVCSLIALVFVWFVVSKFPDRDFQSYGAVLQGVFSVLAFAAIVLGFNYQNEQTRLQSEQIRLQTLELQQANLITLHLQFEQSWERLGWRLVDHLALPATQRNANRSDLNAFEILLSDEANSKLEASIKGSEPDELIAELLRIFVKKFDDYTIALKQIDQNALLIGALLDSKPESVFHARCKKELCVFLY